MAQLCCVMFEETLETDQDPSTLFDRLVPSKIGTAVLPLKYEDDLITVILKAVSKDDQAVLTIVQRVK